VGFSVRIIVADPTRDRSSPLVLANPRIVDAAGRDVAEEGCLSIPGVRGRVHRGERVIVEYQTLERRDDRIEASGLLARILQHEIDHLEGILFVDRLGPGARFAVKGALRRLASAAKRVREGAV
jgi:peptide deformylase